MQTSLCQPITSWWVDAVPPTDPPALWPAWWTRGQTASAPERERWAAASELPSSKARVWWWNPASPQSSPSRSASRSAALASLWGGRRRHRAADNTGSTSKRSYFKGLLLTWCSFPGSCRCNRCRCRGAARTDPAPAVHLPPGSPRSDPSAAGTGQRCTQKQSATMIFSIHSRS